MGFSKEDKGRLILLLLDKEPADREVAVDVDAGVAAVTLKGMLSAAAGAASSSQAGAGAGAATGFTVRYRWNKQSKSNVFNNIPAWDQVVETGCTLFAKAFVLETADFKLNNGDIVEEATWGGVASRTPVVELTMYKATKGFSDFDKANVAELLSLNGACVVDPASFPSASLQHDDELEEGVRKCLHIAKVKDLLRFVGTELALRCMREVPWQNSQEAGRRDLISPILYAAALLAEGGVVLRPEVTVSGTVATGRIDYVMLYKDFSIVVFEAKYHDLLEDHLGQLAAEMRSCREQFAVRQLKKRKRGSMVEEEEFADVPSYGVMTNGRAYKLYKWNRSAGQLVATTTLELALHQDMDVDKGAAVAEPIIRSLVGMIKAHCQALDAMYAKRQRTAP